MAKPSQLAHLTAAKKNLKRQIALDSKTNAPHGLNSFTDDMSEREEFGTVDAVCVNNAANYPFTLESNSKSKTDNFTIPPDFDATDGEYYKVFYISREKSKEVFMGSTTDIVCLPETDPSYQKLIYNLALGIGGGKAIVDASKVESLPNRGDLLKIDIVRADHAFSSNIISVQASKALRCPELSGSGQPISESGQPSQTAGNLPPLNYTPTPGSTASAVVAGKQVIYNSEKPQADIAGTKFYGGLIVNFNGQGNKRTARLTSIVVHYSCCGNPPKGMLQALGPKHVKDGGVVVGTHFSVDPKGNKYQHLEINRIANHCPYWNHKAVGIDMDGWGYGGCKGPSSSAWEPAPDPLYRALYEMVDDLTKRYGIPRRVLWPSPEDEKRNWFVGDWIPRPYGKMFAKDFDGIVAHGHIQDNRADGIDGVYYLKLRFEGKDHMTAYNLMVQAVNKFKPPKPPVTPKTKQNDHVGPKGKKNK